MTEEFEHEGTTYQPSFEWWQVIEGHTWLADGGNATGYDYVGGIWNKNEDLKVHGSSNNNYPLDEGGTYIYRNDER